MPQKKTVDEGATVTVIDSLEGAIEVGVTKPPITTLEMIDEPEKPGSEAQPLSRIHLLFLISLSLCLSLSHTAANQL